jgi:hypothetical protein
MKDFMSSFYKGMTLYQMYLKYSKLIRSRKEIGPKFSLG